MRMVTPEVKGWLFVVCVGIDIYRLNLNPGDCAVRKEAKGRVGIPGVEVYVGHHVPSFRAEGFALGSGIAGEDARLGVGRRSLKLGQATKGHFDRRDVLTVAQSGFKARGEAESFVSGESWGGASVEEGHLRSVLIP
jgi:hypothetical protein